MKYLVDIAPERIPGELLYSIVCRYHLREANRSLAKSLMECTGQASKTIATTLPTGIEHFSTRFALAASDVLSSHTAYPYYHRFLSAERAKILRTKMLAKSHIVSHIRVNGPHTDGRLPGTFRYCEICAQEDVRRTGIPLWHTDHQLPFATLCARHHKNLDPVTIVDRATNRITIRPPPAKSAGAIDKSNKLSSETRTAFSAWCKYLLELPLDAWTEERTLYELWQALKRNGLILESRRVRITQLRHALEKKEVLGISSQITPTWLATVATRSLHENRCVSVPWAYICLLQALIGAPERLTELDPSARQKTIIRSNAMKYTRKETSANAQRGNGRKLLLALELLEHGKCSACSIAKATSVSVQTVLNHAARAGIATKSRPKTLTRKMRGTIEGMLTRGRTIVDISKRLRLSQTTIYRVLYSNPKVYERRRQILATLIKRNHRANLIRYVRHTSAERSLSAFRKICPDSYAWLRRHDNKCLHAHFRKNRQHPQVLSRVDWVQRDKLYAAQIRAIAQSPVSESQRPVRISKSLLLRKIGLDRLWTRYGNRLPKTRAALASMSESTEVFRMKRVLWAVQRFRALNRPLTVSTILRAAAVRGPVSKKIITGKIHSSSQVVD